jgi:preprotein translocase subunit SecD
MAKKLHIRIIILVIALIIAIFSIINFNGLSGGIQVSQVEKDSSSYLAGISKGEVIKTVDGEKVNSIQAFYEKTQEIKISPVEISIKTENKTIDYSSKVFDFSLDDNNIVTSVLGDSKTAGLKIGMQVLEINNYSLENYTFSEIRDLIEPKQKIEIVTNQGDYVFLTGENLGLTVTAVSKSNVKTGLDIQGGARALIRAEKKLDTKEMIELKSIIEQRLNTYGITDMVIREASNPFTGEQFIVIELAGATPKDLEDLVAQQGKFEAKIGNNTIFIGGKGDITFVCKDDATCAGIQQCTQISQGQNCRFQFELDLSPKAAKRQAEATSGLSENITNGESYLNETLDLYLDDKLIDNLLISSDLKGKETTKVVVSGSGFGNSRDDAIKDAQDNMKKLQTILITGSLPYKLYIEKLDTISPTVGKEFSRSILIAAIVAFLAVCLIIYLRFKKPVLVIPVIITLVSEVLLTFGIAAIIKWNIDLPSIAGIIAAIGTGVDDQIVMLDESQVSKSFSLKERIKRAFFIIFAAYATVLVSLFPLWFAGAGLLRGFALTTAIGITVGVFITRPAFAEILDKITKED